MRRSADAVKLHTCMVSYHRPEALKRSLESYLETVTLPFSLIVVDNGSGPEVTDWLYEEFDYPVLFLGENKYPGYACNRGWEQAPNDTTHLHRADNDFIYREGWCDEVQERFQDRKLGQLGLLTEEVEGPFSQTNVGGNSVITRKLWKMGLRWDERPWPELPEGCSEDSFFTPVVVQYGYKWTRVHRECIQGITTPDPRDPYYIETYASRNISHILDGIE